MAEGWEKGVADWLCMGNLLMFLENKQIPTAIHAVGILPSSPMLFQGMPMLFQEKTFTCSRQVS
jgi:hypothetical protein